MFAIPAEKYVLNPVIEQAMNQIPVLHADRGQCASTTTARRLLRGELIRLRRRRLASLWGPDAWRSNESSMRMLEEIERRSGSGVSAPCEARSAGISPAGFWQPRYRHRDPRADIA